MKRLLPLLFAAVSISCGQTKAAKPKPIAEGPSPGEPCWALIKHGKTDEARTCFNKLASSRDGLARAEGLWGSNQFNDANLAFRDALAAKPESILIRVRWGRFCMERCEAGTSAGLFQEALERDENNAQAILGEALVGASNFGASAEDLAKKALAADPKLVEAQELLAQLALEDMNITKSVEEADKAISMSEEALDAMATRAAMEIIADRSPQVWLDRMAKVNPKYAEGYALIGHFLMINRRYDDMVDYYRKSLAMDPTSDEVRAQLGLELMRLGKKDEAVQLLEAAYNNGWKNATTVNALRLLDTYKNFVTIEGPKSIVRLDKKEADLLKLYVPAELERAIATYEKKYKMTLPFKVQLEVYPNHPDFEVRTVGMPGIGGILGVTFNGVVAMDSPSSRGPAEFHWASTMWHELSHVFVLTATKSRTPRWFTEGWAVHEETAENPDWGDRMSPPVIKAIQEKKLLPIAELERGYIRPTYDNQVIVSYFQGGKICDYIVERWGFQKLLDMMADFAGNHPTTEVIERQLKLKPEDFDKAFLEWLDKKIGPQIAAYDDWRKRMKALGGLVDGGDNDVVIKEADYLTKTFPDYVEKGSPYEIAANAYEKKGDKAGARKELEAWAKQGGRDPKLLNKLSQLQDEAGMLKEAANTLEHLNWIYPVHGNELHTHLGQLYTKLNNPRGAIREYEAVLAEKPIDVAEPHYELAREYLAVGDNAAAETNLLAALESAPGFKPAQKMLLELENKKEKK